jgi:hypothetical protein
MAVKREQVQDEIPQTFPFGVEFQKSLIKLLTRDIGFANAAISYLKDDFFENDVLSWAFRFIERYKEKYNAIPSLSVIMDETRNLDSTMQEYFQLTLETVIESSLIEEAWLKDKVLDFIKRNIFVEGFHKIKEQYNQGKVTEAYDGMAVVMERIYNTAWSPPDREFFFEDFSQRTSQRLTQDPYNDTVPTGIHELDNVLGGGLSLGEMGIWVAYPKRGKSTILVNHGVQAVRRANRNVLHVVLEGSRKMVANRYDTVFAQEEYNVVKYGSFSEDTYKRMAFDYQMYANKLVLRGLTERWDYSAMDIHDEMKELKRLYDWKPDLIVVDYGDLLRGRDKGYKNETDTQRAAFRDLKSLANRGYALWTASQARRPDKDVDAAPEILTSRKIAECFDKVRVADFIGSINQTAEERQANQMRLFAELYRDNEAGKVFLVKSDFSRMTIEGIRDVNEVVHPSSTELLATPLGYARRAKPLTSLVQQRKAAI